MGAGRPQASASCRPIQHRSASALRAGPESTDGLKACAKAAVMARATRASATHSRRG